MSASPPIAARASTSPVAGSGTSRNSPEAGSTLSPLMKSPCSVVATAMPWTLAGRGCFRGSSEEVADADVLGEQLAEAGRIPADVGTTQVASGGVGDHVGAPRRIGDEANA